MYRTVCWNGNSEFAEIGLTFTHTFFWLNFEDIIKISEVCGRTIINK